MTRPEGLFDAHGDRVFRYLYRLVGNADLAKDLTQEVFLRVSRAPLPNDTAAGLRGWVFTIARNVALNHTRDRRHAPAAAGAFEARAPATQELAAALSEALESLAVVDRDVFLLRESAGLSYEEIGAACELTPDAVRSRIHRARLALRDRLGPWLGLSRQRGVQWRTDDRRIDGSHTTRSD